MMKAGVAAAAMAFGLAALAGCSSDDDKSSSSTTAGSSKEAVCEARTKLAKKLKSLEDPSLLLEGKSGIQSTLNSVEKDVNNLTDAAKDDYQPQVEDVKSSLEKLKNAVGDIGSGSLPSNLQDIGEAVQDVGTTTEALLDQVKEDCPS